MSEISPRDAQMAALAMREKVPMSVGVGAESPRAAQMAAMAATVAGGCQNLQGQCAPMAYDPRVVASVMQKQCLDPQAPLPSGLSQDVAAYIQALIATSKYATSPPRIGWECDTLTFAVTATAANAAFTQVTVTPTNSFAADGLVSAAGTSSDILFFMTSLTYDAYNYIDNAPWVSTLFRPEAPCCLNVRSLKIIEKNTAVSLNGTMGPVQTTVTGQAWATLIGQTLFGGNP